MHPFLEQSSLPLYFDGWGGTEMSKFKLNHQIDSDDLFDAYQGAFQTREPFYSTAEDRRNPFCCVIVLPTSKCAFLRWHLHYWCEKPLSFNINGVIIIFSWCPVPPCFFEGMNTRHIIIPLKMLTCSYTTLVGASLSLSSILFPQCHDNHWWVYLSGIDLHKHITLISS